MNRYDFIEEVVDKVKKSAVYDESIKDGQYYNIAQTILYLIRDEIDGVINLPLTPEQKYFQIREIIKPVQSETKSW